MSRLPEKKALILDGAMGTRLFAAGLKNGECPEKWILASPENEAITRSIQAGYAAAGADILYTPTFGANSAVLERNGITGKTAEQNRRLAAITRSAADEYDCLVAGDISSTGLFLEPVGSTSFSEMKDIFRTQASALIEGGVDLFAIETQISLEEARAALIAVREISDKPVIVTLTLEKAGRTLSGDSPEAALVVLSSLGADAFGFNCSQGPAQMKDSFAALAGYIPESIRLVAKPNAGLPRNEDGKTVFELAPQEFAESMKELARMGVSAMGGCCGTDERFISALTQIAPSLPEYTDISLFAANSRSVFPLSPESEISAPIKCDDGLVDNIMCAEGEIINLILESPDDCAYIPEAAMYADRALMFGGDYASLTAAFSCYCGRAVLSPESNLTADEKKKLTGFFNPVILK